MAKSKTSPAKATHVTGAPKKTHQGQGLRSKPSHGRKKARGQGR